ncbi:OsmC family protein [Atopomonas sediminilitoris]|uniref:OsmC family protein n=1 Tax=Atopomonas sediminilitoris TaxID=2919919 RepID=UPI001F4E9677|nr:OsmC family protein [Atopomonas sediminilitoris]MCJ8169048.1 OsmC family protein [Atopomonas sediminilitoris]
MSKQAVVTAVVQSGYRVEVNAREHRFVMDQPAQGGGQDEGPTPLEYVLGALAGCFATLGRIIAHQQKITLHGMSMRFVGDYDPAGLLGRDESVRPGFAQIRAEVDIDAELDQAGKQALLAAIERRCPLVDNLLHGTALDVQLAAPPA